MRASWLSVLLTLLTTTATAGPITLTDLRLVQLAPNPATTISTVASVGDGMLPTFVSTRTDYTLIAAIQGWTAAPGTICIVGPLGTTEWSYPEVIDAITATVLIPRVYRPTLFTAQAQLLGAGREVIDQRTFQWVASSPVPEPATWGLVGVGLLGVWVVRRRVGGQE